MWSHEPRRKLALTPPGFHRSAGLAQHSLMSQTRSSDALGDVLQGLAEVLEARIRYGDEGPRRVSTILPQHRRFLRPQP